MKDSKLLFYYKAEACSAHLFKGNITLGELLINNAKRKYKIGKSKDYSSAFDYTMTSDCIIVDDQEVHAAMFECGTKIYITNKNNISHICIDSNITTDNKEWTQQVYQNLIKKQTPN